MFVPVIIYIGTSMLILDYINFVESMLDIFKKICFILQSAHVATPSGPPSHSRPMHFLYFVVQGERLWISYTLVMQDTIVYMYHESA